MISPERASGLDLRQLASAAVSRLEGDSGLRELRWIAAIHRNTAHDHVHLVVAGMHRDPSGEYRRVDITKARLAAMKEELSHEIERQRAPRLSEHELPIAPDAKAVGPVFPEALAWLRRPTPPVPHAKRFAWRLAAPRGSLIALRSAARRYQRRMQRELEENHHRDSWEQVA